MTFVLRSHRFGCLSIRKFHHDSADAIASYKAQEVKGAKVILPLHARCLS